MKVSLKRELSTRGCDSPFKNMEFRRARCLSITQINDMPIIKHSTRNENKYRQIVRQSMLPLLPPDGYQEGLSKKRVRFHEIVTIVFFRDSDNRWCDELEKRLARSQKELDERDEEILSLKIRMAKIENELSVEKKGRAKDEEQSMKRIIKLECIIANYEASRPVSISPTENQDIKSSTRLSESHSSSNSHMSVDCPADFPEYLMNSLDVGGIEATPKEVSDFAAAPESKYGVSSNIKIDAEDPILMITEQTSKLPIIQNCCVNGSCRGAHTRSKVQKRGRESDESDL